ncbi:MAG: hypothetical protein ACWGNV_05015 [Bacteroidales bacterium]
MKKLLKKISLWLLALIAFVVVSGLVLSFLPSPLKLHHQGISPEKAVEYYRDGMLGINDPLFNYKYTLRFLTMLDVKQLRLPGNLIAPILVGVGDQDELFAVDKVKEFYDQIPLNNKEFLVWKGAKHAEIGKEHWEQIVEWLDPKVL